MADTLQNVELPANQWVDLYAATGISVGDVISVQNLGSTDVYLTVTATQPSPDYTAYTVAPPRSFSFKNSDGDTGAWALSNNKEGLVNVRLLP